MASYKKPRKINIVSLALLLAFLSGAYLVIQYGPAYWRQYKVKEILDEVANKCRGNRVFDDDKINNLEEKAEKKIHAMGVEDGGLRVRIDISSREAHVSATYREVVHHWLVKKVSTMNFTPEIVRAHLGSF